ncbi:MAG: hypothetical protein ACRCZ0_05710 [Cetobacterium sp.]
MNNNLFIAQSNAESNAECCPICLEKIKKWTFWVSQKSKTIRYWLNIKKIACGHIFHSRCINMIYKAQCPLCEYPIFNQNEEAILKCNDISKIIDLLKTYFDYGEFKNIYFYIIKSLSTLPISSNRRKRYLKILTLAYKHCDFTDILAIILEQSSSKSYCAITYEEIHELIQKARINWHKTFNGKTLFELVTETTDNLSIINLILHKFKHHKPSTEVVAQENFIPSAAGTADPTGGSLTNISSLYQLIYPSAPLFDE